MKKNLTSLLFISCLYCSVFAQNEVDSKIETLGIFSGGDNAPFWLTNNKYGLGSTDKNKQYLRASSIYQRKLSDDWTLSGGLDLVGANGFESHVFLQQAYIDASFKKMLISAGMKERAVPFKNMNLFSGAMTLSNNARPVPQVEICFPNFITIPFTKDWLHVKAGGSYGYFFDDDSKIEKAGDGKYPQNVWYHRKYLFVKIKNQKPWSAIIGLEMDTQFGGSFYNKGIISASSPIKFADFFRVLVPMSGGSDSSATDQVNILGNVYGSYHFIFDYNFEDFTLKAYHEHFFEDHSGLVFKNIPDGIYGLDLSLKKKSPISNVVIEYIHTKNQSGPFLWDKTEDIPNQVSAGDDYYNHVEYASISNYGFTMGSPLLTSPIYNKGTSLKIKYSRITAFHMGIGGSISSEIDYRLLLTYSRSWGTSYIPTKNIKNQLSSLIECSYIPKKLDGWVFSGALAYDKSSMVGDNFGLQLKMSKSFSSNF